jgi:hypothetical protein
MEKESSIRTGRKLHRHWMVDLLLSRFALKEELLWLKLAASVWQRKELHECRLEKEHIEKYGKEPNLCDGA